jgi:hypothetical protein
LSRNIFERLLLVAVDEGLSSLGESSKQAIYSHLDKQFNIKKQEIPNRIEAFTGAIENIFGPGANLLEIVIMKHLHQKVRKDVSGNLSENLSFIEYVDAVERDFVKNEGIEEPTRELNSCDQMKAES